MASDFRVFEKEKTCGRKYAKNGRFFKLLCVSELSVFEFLSS